MGEAAWRRRSDGLRGWARLRDAAQKCGGGTGGLGDPFSAFAQLALAPEAGQSVVGLGLPAEQGCQTSGAFWGCTLPWPPENGLETDPTGQKVEASKAAPVQGVRGSREAAGPHHQPGRSPSSGDGQRAVGCFCRVPGTVPGPHAGVSPALRGRQGRYSSEFHPVS